MHKDDEYDHEEGARPSSLIPVRKQAIRDPMHDMQLLRDVEIINARTRAEFGPLPYGGVKIRSKRKPFAESPSRNSQAFPTPYVFQEEDVMKIHKIAMAAALTLGTAASAAAYERSARPENLSADESNAAEPDWKPTSKKGEKSKKPMLGAEYKDIEIFSDFRKKLIEDGWEPVPNPDCHDTVLGSVYDESCSDNPDSISCRLCTLVPEIHRNTGDGYNLMRYMKDGVPLSVTVYGDLTDLDEPGKYGLVPIGWVYAETLNVFLLD